MQRSESLPSQSKAGPCVAMHLIIAMALVMLMAVIATSISLVTLTTSSRIVLYQTVKFEQGASIDEQKALQSSLETGYDVQRAHQVDAGAATEAGADSGASLGAADAYTAGTQQLVAEDVSKWSTGSSAVVSSSGVGSAKEHAASTSSGTGMPQLQHVVVPRLLSETRSTILGALPGSDPGVDGSDIYSDPKVLEEDEQEDFAEQPKQVAQEMIDDLNLGFKMNVPNSLTYSDMKFCPGAEEPAEAELGQLPSNARALFMMSSNAYAKKQIMTALSMHPAFRAPTKSLMATANKGPGSPLDVHYFNKWPLPPVQKFLDCFPKEESKPSAKKDTAQFQTAEEGSVDATVVTDTAQEAVSQLEASGNSLASNIAGHGGDTSDSNSNSNSKLTLNSEADSTGDSLTAGEVTALSTDADEGGQRRLQGGKGSGKQQAGAGTPGAIQEPILLDSTFDYWVNPAVAPRMQAIVPQARFVVILQDPVARAFEQFQALLRGAAKCRDSHPKDSSMCPKPPLFERAVVNEAATGATQRGCFFDTPGANITWSDCFKCAYTNIDFSHCDKLSPENQQLFPPCRNKKVESTSLLQVGNYAPALGWWLAFFSPERFLIIPASDLRTHSAMDKAISRILDHIGADPAAMPDHTAVTPGVPSRVPTMQVSWIQQQAMHLLRSRYQVSEGDLWAMMDLVLPGGGKSFSGVRSETPSEDGLAM